MDPIRIKIKLGKNGTEPTYATDGSGCFDIYSAESVPDFYKTKIISTDLHVEIPPGYVMLIFGRSGHGFKDDIRLSNCVGVIDSDYRGEVLVKLIRDIDSPKTVYLQGFKKGDRIAQALIIPFQKVTFEVSKMLNETTRGVGGFGSTGT